MATMEPHMQRIIQRLYERGIISSLAVKIKQLSGTTEGLVYLISDHLSSYILKLDHPEQIAPVKHFLQTYHQSPLLPKLLYHDPESSYLVYSFLEGTTHVHRSSKKAWMARLVTDLLNYYTPVKETATWGRFGIPRQSWHEFMQTSLEETVDDIGERLPDIDHRLVQRLVHKWYAASDVEEQYLLHGDTGVHNFVFDQYSFVGVIDPSPIVGPVLYDFLYAFCSSPDDLNTDTLISAYSLLQYQAVDETRLIEETAIQLYFRIGICMRHHPEDLPEYLEAWTKWKKHLA
ncbi:aminoglycoside phosphotransferase family protein [Marinicrinis lubricantis]|uniref:Aminoglycoside phosphotransferase family protein n=1 Tax=Marinicrinis lubricantis TaxID=2086470 RepID=A0ABW1IS97_9BACL